MRKNSTMKNRATKSVARRRAAVVTGGLVAAIALGSTATALAAGTQHGGIFGAGAASSIAEAVHKQATEQKAAAVKKAAEDKKAAEEKKAEEQKAAQDKKAAQHKAAEQKAAAARKAAADRKAAAQAKQRAQAKAAADRKARANGWVTPTSGYVIGAGYAQAGPHWAHKHSGQDFVVPSGTTVRAAHGGTVVEADWGGAYGNNIVIRHADHTYTQYGHLSKLEVWPGEHVNTAQEIGKSGSTGNSTGPHLHFEVRTTPYYGSSLEPLHFLRAHGVSP